MSFLNKITGRGQKEARVTPSAVMAATLPLDKSLAPRRASSATEGRAGRASRAPMPDAPPMQKPVDHGASIISEAEPSEGPLLPKPVSRSARMPCWPAAPACR